jgi:isochorismate hydrolase
MKVCTNAALKHFPEEACPGLDPARTALIVIDMQNVWVKQGMPAFTPTCEAIVPNINRLAAAMAFSAAIVRSAWRPKSWMSHDWHMIRARYD